MATPHVAGSAALLAQQHPAWKAGRLKAALMSTAARVTDSEPYSVGAGRLDVARATSQPVTATGSVSIFMKWADQDRQHNQGITWHNTGTAAVTLTLEAALARRDGAPAPAGLVTLSADTVTVPAGGNATVELTVKAQDGAAGEYGGVLTARSADDTVRTHTVLSVVQEKEMYDLTVNLLDRAGAVPVAAGDSSVAIDNLDNSDIFHWGGAGKLRLPAGRYAVKATIATPRAGQEPSYSFIANPELVTRWITRRPDRLIPDEQARLTDLRARSPRLDAVVNGLTLPHSSGAVEGNVTRVKALKRSRYGRRPGKHPKPLASWPECL
ncbi:S8 family serine peptidase [Nonomuraea basaltis]|uniref:S8 family serine peptidase n=1 Tax=Nonomuraea basaltis TaxID=2495887 RepID=UPI00110C56EF|nr:S8 family serine peptidase [Nonomuraea basaltis]TMR91883.1 hypothetical protein EJK15_47520 [Nonomuraea basaltis]